MVTAVINALGRWIAGVPWMPLSVGPGPTWTLRFPNPKTGANYDCLEFLVADSRYPKLSGALWIEFLRGEARVKFQVTQSKGVISSIGGVALSSTGELLTAHGVLGRLDSNEEDRQLVRSWLREKQSAA
jgi:hypothetical protein